VVSRLCPLPRDQRRHTIEEIKELFQNFIAPQLEGIRGDIRALSSDIRGADVKVESYRRALLAEIWRVEEVLSAAVRPTRRKSRSASRRMNEKIDLQRRELLAEIRAALK
jgi:hypothetical protein